MKKKIGVGLFAVVAFIAFQAQNVATDKGSKTIINHSNGVLTFPFDKLEPARGLGVYGKLVNYFSTAAVYPTTFVVTDVQFDGGCKKHNLVDGTASLFPTGVTAGNPFYCQIDVPFGALDAGVFTIYRELDGGYAVSQCPAIARVPTSNWPALCTVQAGRSP